MADMVDSGYHCFNTWAKQTVSPNGTIFYNRWLGEFNPEMTSDEANLRLDYVGKITEKGQQDFKRGWDKARDEFVSR